MAKISVTNLAGQTRDIDAEVGLTLMENIRENEFDDLQALCGGCCSCCTCHVYVTEGIDTLEPRADDEADLLEESEHYDAAHSRLSCQIEVTDALVGLAVTIAPE